MKIRYRIIALLLVMAVGLSACGTSSTEDNAFVTEENKAEIAKEVNREEFSSLLAGGLTEEQLMFVLAHGPKTMINKGLNMNDLNMLLLHAAAWETPDSLEVPIHGWKEGEYEPYLYYDVAMVNNMLSVLTDFTFAEANNGQCMGVTVAGDVLQLNLASPYGRNYGTILSAKFVEEEMIIDYEVTMNGEEGETSECRTALLRKNADGLYQVNEIHAYVESMEEEWKIAYKDVLLGIMREDSIYMFDPEYKDSAYSYLNFTYQYALHDLDCDGMPELLVKYDRVDIDSPVKVFNYVDGAVNELGGELKEAMTTYISVYPGQKGLSMSSTDRWSGAVTFKRYEIVGNALEIIDAQEFAFDDVQWEALDAGSILVEWQSAFDLNTLGNYSIGVEAQ